MRNINTRWDYAKFAEARHEPVVIGRVEDEARYMQPPVLAHLEDTPIKFPGSDYRIPRELEQYAEVICKVADYWARINPDEGDDYYCYVSLTAGAVPPETAQRAQFRHTHCDGFQSSTHPDFPHKVDVFFSVFNTAPTTCARRAAPLAPPPAHAAPRSPRPPTNRNP